MKFQLPALALLFSFVIPAFSQDDEAKAKIEADLEKARELFPKFQKLLETDPEKAKEPFDQFLKMADPMQLRLQTWLDTKWGEKRREYEMASGGTGSGGGGLNETQKATLREKRALLEEIRGLRSEDEMKKRLKSEGWNALETLLSLTKRAGGGGNTSAGNSVKANRLLGELIEIGNYRYLIRFNRSQPAKKPHTELGIAEPTSDDDSSVPAAESMSASRDDLAVLRKNEEMKGDIPSGEYDGILQLNQWRIALGLNALLIDPKLCEASRDHSKDMKAMGFFAHDSPVKGKKTPWDRAKNFGTSAGSENIAINGSPQGANTAWFYSPGHHKNMFAAGRTHVGLGNVGRHYTQMFR